MTNKYQGQESRVCEESVEEPQYFVFITVRKTIDNVLVNSIYLQN